MGLLKTIEQSHVTCCTACARVQARKQVNYHAT